MVPDFQDTIINSAAITGENTFENKAGSSFTINDERPSIPIPIIITVVLVSMNKSYLYNLLSSAAFLVKPLRLKYAVTPLRKSSLSLLGFVVSLLMAYTNYFRVLS